MARVCVRHPFELSENLCGICGQDYCSDCLVHPHGSRKLPLCVNCALTAGGVRSNARNKAARSRREIKKLARERRAEDKALARLKRESSSLPPIANPFTAGWATTDDLESVLEDRDDRRFAPTAASAPLDDVDDPPQVFHIDAPAPAASPSPPLPHAAPPPAATALPPLPPPPPNTLANLLPDPFSEPVAARSPFDMSADVDHGVEAEEERPWRVPALPASQPPESEEPKATDPSQMIAWLDEIFAPRSVDADQ